MMRPKKLISIITPVLNEEEVLPRYFDRIQSVLVDLEDEYNFEIIFTDNRSTDKTFELLRQYSEVDHQIFAVRFSKNFGYQRSIWTGYSLSRGDAVFVLDADLQDPPELLAIFLKSWKQGSQVVYGVRRRPEDSVTITMMRRIFYRFLRRISTDNLPTDAGDFMLVDRTVVDHVKAVYDPNIYVRGVVFSVGFTTTAVKYDRARRTLGETKFPLRKMVSLAVDGIVRHSDFPLRVSLFFGLSFSLIATIGILSYLFGKIYLFHDWPPGFTTLIIVQLFTVGFLSVFLSIIGEYLLRIYKLLKREPMSIIDDVLGERIRVDQTAEESVGRKID
jgi:polyisoprenyl-phosphate glycosyltransferase